MINLAGVRECDVHMRSELVQAGVPIIDIPRENSEVPYTVMGKLGKYEFRRAWYYWMVNGNVPLEAAQEMYADPIGKKDVRVAGHCGCPPPEEWTRWYTTDGKLVVKTKELPEYRKFIDKGIFKESVLDDLVFTDDPQSVGALGFIEHYHIDSQEGLNLYVATIKKYMELGKI